MVRQKKSVVGLIAVLITTQVSSLRAQTTPPAAAAAPTPDQPAFTSQEIEQLVAPIALYPDSLISQILMASTYPLEVVQAERFAKNNAKLNDAALTAALEKESWEASVKSLVNFPTVLTMMNEKLESTVQLGDAFIADQKAVLDAVQRLRVKAKAQGNLEATKEQKVIVETVPQSTTQIIRIEPTNPQVVYVPTYNPTVVYGAWPYPAHPPYYYHPPGYVAAGVVGFGLGVAAGAAWGYAWGNCNWGGNNVDIDVNRNTNINQNINRNIQNTNINGGKGNFQHNPAHRQGVAYHDKKTAQNFGTASSTKSTQAREQFRGRAETGRRDLPAGGSIQNRPSTGNLGGGAGAANRPSSGNLGGGAGAANRPSTGNPAGGAAGANRPSTGNLGGASGAANRPSTGNLGGGAAAANRPSTGNIGGGAAAGNRPSTGNLGGGAGATNRPSTPKAAAPRPSTGKTGSAMSGVGGGGGAARTASQRGATSRSTPARSAPARSAPARSAPARSSGGGGAARRR